MTPTIVSIVSVEFVDVPRDRTKIVAKMDNGVENLFLASYYHGKVAFSAGQFIGLTVIDARNLVSEHLADTPGNYLV
jgi:hypothetical protein